jgi:hypothetical protein
MPDLTYLPCNVFDPGTAGRHGPRSVVAGFGPPAVGLDISTSHALESAYTWEPSGRVLPCRLGLGIKTENRTPKPNKPEPKPKKPEPNKPDYFSVTNLQKPN